MKRVFGYGSLLNVESLKKDVPEPGNIIPGCISGFRREFSVWDPTGYKHGPHANIGFCALNVSPNHDKDVMVNGVIFEVADCREDDSVCSESKPVCCGFSGVCMTQELAALSAEEGGCGPVQPPISKLLYDFRTGKGEPQEGVPMVSHNLTCEAGEVQSPSPYRGSDGNCVNAMISASFIDITGAEVPMIYENMDSDSIELWQCATNLMTIDKAHELSYRMILVKFETPMIDLVNMELI